MICYLMVPCLILFFMHIRRSYTSPTEYKGIYEFHILLDKLRHISDIQLSVVDYPLTHVTSSINPLPEAKSNKPTKTTSYTRYHNVLHHKGLSVYPAIRL